MSDRRATVTSHWVVDEACCRAMAKKYGWTLQEIRRHLEAKDPLSVECRFQGKAEFPSYMETVDQ